MPCPPTDTASPFYIGTDNNSSVNASGQAYEEEFLLPPAVDGTKAVLRVALEAGTIKKVIVTASTACVYVNYGAWRRTTCTPRR